MPIVQERKRLKEHEDATLELRKAGISLNEIQKVQQEERESKQYQVNYLKPRVKLIIYSLAKIRSAEMDHA